MVSDLPLTLSQPMSLLLYYLSCLAEIELSDGHLTTIQGEPTIMPKKEISLTIFSMAALLGCAGVHYLPY